MELITYLISLDDISSSFSDEKLLNFWANLPVNFWMVLIVTSSSLGSSLSTPISGSGNATSSGATSGAGALA